MKISREESKQKRIAQHERIASIGLAALSNSELVDLYIEMNEEAEKYDFQCQLFVHDKIKKITGSAMKGLSEDQIVDLFYWGLRDWSMFNFKEKQYPFFQKAFERLLLYFKAGNYAGGIPNKSYIFFGVEHYENIEKIFSVSFDEYAARLKFIKQAWNYSNYPALRKRREKFTVFLDDEVLMTRARKSVSLFENFDMTAAACLALLLEDKGAGSKEILMNENKRDLGRSRVWLLGSFYKSFQKTKENKLLLSDLYSRYPKDWIDVYYND